MPEHGEAWITGIGIASSLGEGREAHWSGLCAGQPVLDEQTFAPCIVHPLAPIAFDAQIPKKSDQRQMEPWQRIGVYAAGLALDDAGLKGDAELLARTDMIVAAGGGERDIEMDERIFAAIDEAPDREAFLSERLRRDLRPTLFLAQLSNMLAGNISIVHGVTGSSRSFMGEEAAGADAIATAWGRIVAGQGERALVGGSNNAERYDLLLNMMLAGHALQPPFRPVWERSAAPGFAVGSLGAFLVLEAPDKAAARERKPLARLTHVQSGRTRRTDGAVTAALARMWDALAPRLRPGAFAIFSGASGAAPVTAEEQAFLRSVGAPVRATGSLIGHSLEPQFVMNIALAALAIGQGTLYGTGESADEDAMAGPLRQVVVTGVGHRGGEALALVEAA